MINLVGAALGCVLFVLLLEPLGAPRMLFALSAISTVVAWVGLNVVGLRSMGQWWNVICAATFALCGYGLIRPDMMGEMRPSPDKNPGAQPQHDRQSGCTRRAHGLESRGTPRHLPLSEQRQGLSRFWLVRDGVLHHDLRRRCLHRISRAD